MLAASGRAAVRRVAGRRGASTHASHGHGSAHTAAPAHPPAQHGGRTALAHELEEEAHATASTLTWKRISYVVALPAVGICAYSSLSGPAHEPPPFEDYSTFRNIRSKPFPWGSGERSLFWNPHVNHMAGEEAHGESHEEYLNPIAAWIEYNLNKEEENKEIAHEHLRTTKANAEANKRSVKVFTTAMKMNHDNSASA